MVGSDKLSGSLSSRLIGGQQGILEPRIRIASLFERLFSKVDGWNLNAGTAIHLEVKTCWPSTIIEHTIGLK